VCQTAVISSPPCAGCSESSALRVAATTAGRDIAAPLSGNYLGAGLKRFDSAVTPLMFSVRAEKPAAGPERPANRQHA
jgi:hypothetical protein